VERAIRPIEEILSVPAMLDGVPRFQIFA